MKKSPEKSICTCGVFPGFHDEKEVSPSVRIRLLGPLTGKVEGANADMPGGQGNGLVESLALA